MIKKLVKILKQLAIIYILFLVGNFISDVIRPFILIPGNIIGMVILFVLLINGFIKLSMIEETGNFLLKYMGFFFIPLFVGVMDSYKIIQDSILQILIILIVSCICVMFVSAKVTDLLITFMKGKNQ